MKINNTFSGTFLKAGLLVLAIFTLYFFFTANIVSASTIYCANGIEMTSQELAVAVGAGKVTTSLSRQGGTEIAHIVNNTNCNLPISVSSYKVFEPLPALSSQQFYDGTSVRNIGGNQSADLSVSVAACKTQIDIWYKDAPRQLYTGTIYDNYNTLPFAFNAAMTTEDYCTFACSANSDCGTNGYVGSPFCQGNGVYKNYKTYTCSNPGTANSYCSNSTNAQLQQTCTSNQTCSNGSCVQNELVVSCYAAPNPANTNQSVNFIAAATGGSGSYTYSWSGACTGGSQVCSNSFSQPGTKTATINVTSGNQTNNSSCSVNINQGCTSHSYQQCSGNNLYWYNSCGNQEELSQYCPNGCSGSSCNQQHNISVQTNSATNIYNNQATLNGYLNSNCSSGSCAGSTSVWFQWGTSASYGNETTRQSINYSGSFSQNIANLNSNTIYHFRAVAQSGAGQIVYGQDMTFSTSGTSGNLLTVNKTARNLTSGNYSGFSNTIYANPSDTLMFMITIQATGNQDVQNAVVRDYLANNLIYKNQLIVSGAANYSSSSSGSYNYGGDITSGINLGAIPAGQTITITYQTQVASAQNFAYGTTTLTNSVSVTSSNSGYNPTSNASIIVTRTAIYGASSISTGLTNNLWVDSFFIPLAIALVGVWLMRSGMFFGIRKWADNRKKIYKDYKTEKKLNSRIAKIRKTEGV